MTRIPDKPLLTRKDIATMLVDVTPDQVRKNEKAWGLDRARKDLNPRCVRYRRVMVIAVFTRKGWI